MEQLLEATDLRPQKDLEATTKWFNYSGLKVNESKIKLCLFDGLDNVPIF
jgi:hypothetical protein